MVEPPKFLSGPSNGSNFKFGEASFEQLTDCLVYLNKRNKDNLQGLPPNCGDFKKRAITEDILLIGQQLGLDPLVGYQAGELLQRFMVQHLTERLRTSPPSSASDRPGVSHDAFCAELTEKFPLIIFSCIQLASKLSFHSEMIDNNAAVHWLRALGHSVTKQGVLQLELMVLKQLQFRLDVPDPLTYVETLLEVLGHNEPSVPVKRLYPLCQRVLRFIILEKEAVYDGLLITTVQSVSPSQQQRDKFVTVTEDCMLLGVGVISVATFILCFRIWQPVVGELSHITGISERSVTDLTHVTVKHIIKADLGSSQLLH